MDIKLVIWDLDDTLWSGTLAEGDDVVLNEDFATVVKALNIRGVVSSICSKNDEAQAREKLMQFGLWDQFVFPFISFSPKGEAISTMIEQMQLRAPNVLFIDDNANNLAEVKAREPEINVADSRALSTLELLRGLVAKYEGIRKSRIEKYRALETRHKEWRENTGSREDFLRSCEITMAIAERTDNVDFVERIEELINRTNQMNFTKSRVEAGSMLEPIIANNGSDLPYSIFVWDKYGYHGLVGFAFVEKRTKLRHFLFSCRIMHMGVEQRVLYELSRHWSLPELDISTVPVKPETADWIKVVRFADPEVRAQIAAQEKKGGTKPEVRVMANCQSSAIAHFGGFSARADSDNWPRVFNLQYFATGKLPNMYGSNLPYNDNIAAMICYGVFNDYGDEAWTRDAIPSLEDGFYRECAEAFSNFVRDTNRKVVAVLPPAESQFVLPETAGRGLTERRLRNFNAVWMNIAQNNPNISILRIGVSAETADVLAEPEEIWDSSHFLPSLLKRVGERVGEWFSENRIDISNLKSTESSVA